MRYSSDYSAFYKIKCEYNCGVGWVSNCPIKYKKKSLNNFIHLFIIQWPNSSIQLL